MQPLLRLWITGIVNLRWASVIGAISRNREPSPEELAAALASGEGPPDQIRERIAEITDPTRKRPRGRPAYWGEKDRIRLARLTLRCQLVDRLIQDRNVARAFGARENLPISKAFRWVEALTLERRYPKPCVRTTSPYLLRIGVDDRNAGGKTVEQHYYVWQRPSPALLRQVQQRMDEIMDAGLGEYAAADIVSNEGVYPRRSNKLRLPPRTIVSFYRRAPRQ